MRCDYGCGELAKFKFKNGKFCCSSNTSKCNGVINNRIPKAKTYTVSTIYKKYPNLCKIEEFKEGPNGEILARCKNSDCENSKENDGWFEVTVRQIYFRNKHIHRNYFCCCEECKTSVKIQLGKIIVPYKIINESENLLCSYGCGQIAKFRVNDEKICCSDFFTKCPNQRQYTKDKNKLTYSLAKERNPFLFHVEEFKEGPNGEILGRCKNSSCKNSKENDGWFEVSRSQIHYRNLGIHINDTNYFYCCEECKQECPLYHSSASTLNNIIDGKFKNNQASQSELTIWKFEVFVRQLKDNQVHEENFCEICHETENLVGHHILPQKLYPEFALDIDNGIVLCSKCHIKYGHEKGTECSTGYLANKICK
jgi:hypothetical protein